MARLKAEASMCGVGDSLYDDGEGSAEQPWYYPKHHNKTQRQQSSSAMQRLQDYFKANAQDSHARNWRARPEIPTSNEIMDLDESWENNSGPVVPLEGNNVTGAFESKEQYLRTHYGLLREDAVVPLRNARGLVKMSSVPVESLDRGWQSIGIYSRVHIRGLTFAKRGIAFEVSFSLRSCRSNVNWELTDRLISGSLVALSRDRFHKHCIVATIAARDPEKLALKPPRIDLYIHNPDQYELDPQEELIMVEERSGFFEAQRYTMLSLQRLHKESFPLSNMIVKVERETETAAQYIADKPVTDATEVFGQGFEKHNVLERAHPEKSTMDETQLKAIHHVLSNKLSIVQGPPGTGKTYVSVLSLKLLLNLLEDDATPIIVACQTNHALDQLLGHIASSMPEGFARLGGQSKDQGLIKQRTMIVLRKGLERHEKDPMKTFARQRREHENKIEDIMSKLSLYTSGTVTVKDFEQAGIITPEQCQSIESGISMFVGTSQRTSARKRAVQSTSSEDDPMGSLKTWLGGELEVTKSLDIDDSHEYGFQEEEDLWELEIINERKAEAGIGDDFIDQLKGRFLPLHLNWRGRTRHNMLKTDAERLLKNKNLSDGVPARQRGGLFNYMLAQLKAKTLKDFKNATVGYDRLVKDFQRWVFERDLIILQKQRLIGMTTTGLAKFRPLLHALAPKVVMIEEAAESLEAPVVAACVPSLQHLILVGDHQQLKPCPVVRQHADEPFYFGLSLMERMLNNDMAYQTLGVQRRMAPQISANLFPIYGDKIRDHDTVKDRKPVDGMMDTEWVYNHSHLDTKDQYMSSQNVGEADMVVGLYLYLLQNGMHERNITVLTFYKAQRKLLIQKIHAKCRQQKSSEENVVTFRPEEHIPDVRTVDSYQGEENEVIILSLVRSTGSNSIGFAGLDNRICVAVSRAKFGFYIFGNMDLFTASSATWRSIHQIMQDKEKVGNGQMRVRCTNHYKITSIETAEDWDRLNGGCTEPCELKLDCGHACPARCHPNGHELIDCRLCKKLPEVGGLTLNPEHEQQPPTSKDMDGPMVWYDKNSNGW